MKPWIIGLGAIVLGYCRVGWRVLDWSKATRNRFGA